MQINYSSIEIKVRFNLKFEPDKRVRLYLYNYASLHPHNNDVRMYDYYEIILCIKKNKIIKFWSTYNLFGYI